MRQLKDPFKQHKVPQYKRINQSYIERQKWYLTAKWKAISKNYLAKHPFCVKCMEPATVVDHVEGHDYRTWKERFYVGPFQSMCWSCHSRKTVLEEQHKSPPRLTSAERKEMLNKVLTSDN